MITQWKESYERLRKQMRIETIIASPVKDFSILSMVTDAWVPSCDVWIGDYPYLNKDSFKEFTSSILSTLNDSENNYYQYNDNRNNDYNNINDSTSMKWTQDKERTIRQQTKEIPSPSRAKRN